MNIKIFILNILILTIFAASCAAFAGLTTFYKTNVKYYDASNNPYYTSYNCSDVCVAFCFLSTYNCFKFQVTCNYYIDNIKHKFQHVCWNYDSINCNQNYKDNGVNVVFIKNQKHFTLTGVFLILLSAMILITGILSYRTIYVFFKFDQHNVY